MYGLFPLSFCPFRPFHTGPYVSPPSLSCSLSGLNASLSSVRQFWTPSILVLAVSAAQSRERASHLRADRWCRRQLVDGFGFFYCPSLFSLLHFFWDLFPFLFSFLSTHLCQPVCRFFIFSFLSVRFHRLNVIFSKFDEVQRSGNMISSSGSGEFELLCFVILTCFCWSQLCDFSFCASINKIYRASLSISRL